MVPQTGMLEPWRGPKTFSRPVKMQREHPAQTGDPGPRAPWVISHYQARPALVARHQGQDRVRFSLDLGRSQVEVILAPEGLVLPQDMRLPWSALEQVAQDANACFAVHPDGTVEPIRRFSEAFNRVYVLYPTPGPPTLLISGIPMHRIQGTDPARDTASKLRALSPVVGRVLDTATGLGYTAIRAARSADLVLTIELDPVVLEVARWNPWSQELFTDPRIEQRIGDADHVVRELPQASFHRVVHDPPMFRLAPHLYTVEFYAELHRVLRPGGRLFHYVGSPERRSSRSVTRGVVQRLKEAGFSRVKPWPRAFGVVAYR